MHEGMRRRDDKTFESLYYIQKLTDMAIAR